MEQASLFNGFRTVLMALVPSLTDDDWAAVERLVSPARLSAGTPLVDEGEVCRRVAYVHQGSFVYFTLHDGRRSIIGFDFEGEVAGDFQSFFEATPAVKSVAALEDSYVLMLTRELFETLARRNPAVKQIRSTMAEHLFEGA